MPAAPSSSVSLLLDAFDRVRELVPDIVAGLDADALAWRPGPEANSIAWLVWHLTRIQDDHVADLAGREQAWTAAGWYERFALCRSPPPTTATGTAPTTWRRCGPAPTS